MRCLPSFLLFLFFGDMPIWLAHHSKKVATTSFVAPIIWMHQISAITIEANFLARAIDRTVDTTVLLSLLFVAASSSSSLGHVQRVSAHKQANKQLSRWALVQRDVEHRHWREQQWVENFLTWRMKSSTQGRWWAKALLRRDIVSEVCKLEKPIIVIIMHTNTQGFWCIVSTSIEILETLKLDIAKQWIMTKLFYLLGICM